MQVFFTLFIIVILLGFFFIVGFLLGYSNGYKLNTDELKTGISELYCFECEIEMPVKEKNGRLSCKNCGLRH